MKGASVAIAILLLSCGLGALLDLGFGVKSPALRWFIGTMTGMIAFSIGLAIDEDYD